MEPLKHVDVLIDRYPELEGQRENIIEAYKILEQSYDNGGKLLVAGNGGSAADSEHIVGELMKGFENPRKLPQEYVDRLEDIYSLTDIVILPLLSGGGVKGKLLEAAAFGKTIISTPHGIEGTEFLDERDVLLGKSADDFSRKCVLALNDINLSVQLSVNAKKTFEKLYDWDSIGERYNEYLLKECGDFYEKKTSNRYTKL